MYKYRVRGIYATAIAKLLLDSGAALVDVSEKLSKRLGIPRNLDEPPHATVKVSERDPERIVIVGFQDAVKYAYTLITSRVPDTIGRLFEVGPYSTIKIVISERRPNGDCIAESPIGSVQLVDSPCIVGEESYAHVVRVPQKPGEPYVVRMGAAAVEDSVTLIDDKRGRVEFSEHIKDLRRKAELMALALQYSRRGYSVKWRSYADDAPTDKILADLDNAASKLSNLKGDVAVGESLAFVVFTRSSLRYLDSLRRQVVPTTLHHHQMKLCGIDERIVDTLDFISSRVELSQLERALDDYLLQMLASQRSAVIVHSKPWEEYLEIGPLEILGVISTQHGAAVVGLREIRAQGVYDGLEVPKEVGDKAYTFVFLDKPYTIHVYTSSDGRLKGVYINVNTPPIVCSDKIRYIDLLVDVVFRDEQLKVVDLDEFENFLKMGFDASYAEEVAKKALNEISERGLSIIQSLLRALPQLQRQAPQV